MDQDLIDRAKQGDKDAFTTLVMRHGDRLYSVAFRILRDTTRAEDAVQQTFLTAWRELRRLRDDDRLEAWLYRLLVNACFAELRHMRRWQPGLRVITDPEPACPPMTPRSAWRSAMSSSERSADCPVSSGRYSRCITTSDCPAQRSRKSSVSRRAPSDRDFITQDN
jgi:RNA polymerase sigma factor (sigma-70 family)